MKRTNSYRHKLMRAEYHESGPNVAQVGPCTTSGEKVSPAPLGSSA